jgi:EAL domain-containing protein (putative c-di-GMP-specific phosphodiesterase class I)
LARLRQSGVAVVLNDFVLNDTAIAYLDARLVDRVRLSIALTGEDAPGPARQAYLAAAIETARASGLPVTVPGLERKEQAARLLKLGCREFQGSLLAAPMPIAALTQLILAPAKPRKAG